jgi:UDP-N-acetylmuramoylalanine--D-glutamate ligase
MRIDELSGKRITIWGAGQEGLAAEKYLSSKIPGAQLVLIDENERQSFGNTGSSDVVTDPLSVRNILQNSDVIVKSPGVSLYHPLLREACERGAQLTSLLNLWFRNEKLATTIAVTGTKGKSTTSTLLRHTLAALGKTVAIAGNIGVPVTELETGVCELLVLEVSSFQAANFSGSCDFGVLTSLYPEHLDWHGSIEQYYRDKAQLLTRSRIRLVDAASLMVLEKYGVHIPDALAFNSAATIHVGESGVVLQAGRCLGPIRNAFLNRRHNHGNVCAVLSVIDQLGMDLQQALDSIQSYQGLPHRQQELGSIDGVLYVDDSISTIPQSTVAAAEAYAERPQTLIVGGHDRGVDHAPLINLALHGGVLGMICLGPSGARLHGELKAVGFAGATVVASMQEAVATARQMTPHGGVVLLSPGASSFGMFKNYIERAESFRLACGL